MRNVIIWLVFSGLFFTALLAQCPVWAESTRIPKNTSAESADETAIRQRIQTLQKQLKTAQKQYDEGRPKLSDSAYDARYQELLKLEHAYPQYQTADSVTNLIGTVGTKESAKGRQSQPLLSHHTPMLSLQKAYQISEIEAWIQSVRELGKLSASTPLVLVVEPKWDG
ncbi:MAG: hypothetical protein VKK59_01520, partial [Vampirovibrionales bacterium]|nr:hypothetical protein [Vampirovibrionales bacterium]